MTQPAQDPPEFRVNDETPVAGVKNPFKESQNKEQLWLPPEPEKSKLPNLHAFWESMADGITGWRVMKPICENPPDLRISRSLMQQLMPLDSGQLSRSPNWSGVSVHAAAGVQFTQVAGCWVEPEAARVGPDRNNMKREFRSSVWIGCNGHAGYLDAALPQAGTCQQIVHRKGAVPTAWETRHWVWFQWWAIGKGQDEDDLRMPVYVDVDLQAEDRVWCNIDLINGFPNTADPPEVARVTLCVEHNERGDAARSKTLVMPFLMYPPKNRQSRRAEATGTTANWIVELPRISNELKDCEDFEGPFLMPQLEGPAEAPVTFQHCVAGCADAVGLPVSGERALEVSKRINMIDIEPDQAGGKRIRVMSEVLRLPLDEGRVRDESEDTNLRMLVPGNGA
jgi:hypothetical protein